MQHVNKQYRVRVPHTRMKGNVGQKNGETLGKAVEVWL